MLLQFECWIDVKSHSLRELMLEGDATRDPSYIVTGVACLPYSYPHLSRVETPFWWIRWTLAAPGIV